MQRRGFERVLREIAEVHGVRVSAVGAVRIADGWRVSVIDTHDRLHARVVPDGPPASVRDVLTTWWRRGG